MARELNHESDARRYILRIDDELVSTLDYTVNGERISFTRSYTAPKQRGHGYAADVVQFAVDDVEANTDYRIVPMCWYVGEWFDKHPDRGALLAR
jgi:predicted GNAT family acetyltransferase